MTHPLTNLCTYRVQEGKEDAFLALLEKHWPALHGAGLAADQPPLVYRGVDESGKTYFVEILFWKDPEGPKRAHELPAVMAVWEPMGAITEDRLGRPKMEFPVVDEVHLDSARA